MRSFARWPFVAIGLVFVACDDGVAASSSAGDGGASTVPNGDGAVPSGGGCDTHPLKTGITAVQTGVSADAFDCQILASAAKYGEPDPMIFKAIMYGESRFDHLAVGCPNAPCGTPDGWSAEETGCYGLMQVVAACNKAGDPGMLPNGHPNLTKDPGANGWAGSVFNPDVNVELGVRGVSGNREQVKKEFPGCTDDQYTLMAVGNYASYGSTKSCTEVNRDYLDGMLKTYREYAAAAGYAARPYP